MSFLSRKITFAAVVSIAATPLVLSQPPAQNTILQLSRCVADAAIDEGAVLTLTAIGAAQGRHSQPLNFLTS